MTLQGVIKDFNLSDDIYYILKKKDIKIPIKRYKNIEVCEYWYDDESRPDTCCWIEVEGIGYGWIWCAIQLSSFPKIKIGNTYRIPKEKYLKWISDNIRKTIFL